VAFSGVLDHVGQEGTIAAVPAQQVEAVETAFHQRVDHAQPEILKSPSTGS
jgi:hypothetical protein